MISIKLTGTGRDLENDISDKEIDKDTDRYISGQRRKEIIRY